MTATTPCPAHPLSMAQPGPLPGVVTASPADTDTLSPLIAHAFFALPPSRWLIADPAARRAIFPAYFRIYVEHALTTGIVHITPDRTAAALWMPTGTGLPGPPPGYDQRLAAVTGPHYTRFAAFDATLERHHPAGTAHHHLALLAVDPGHQGHGTGSMLLRAHHATLDHDAIPAYLEAATMRTRRLYHRHGYTLRPDAPIRLPGSGTLMWPMWRQPRRTSCPAVL
jgi:GNAT superfamily N-acetyltransferase